MIDNDIQSCLTYDIEIIFSNRLYNCIIELKDIFVIFCVTVYNKICIKKLFVVKEFGLFVTLKS
jgi:hypothetical protein